jgi:hypothetical protein
MLYLNTFKKHLFTYLKSIGTFSRWHVAQSIRYHNACTGNQKYKLVKPPPLAIAATWRCLCVQVFYFISSYRQKWNALQNCRVSVDSFRQRWVRCANTLRAKNANSRRFSGRRVAVHRRALLNCQECYFRYDLKGLTSLKIVFYLVSVFALIQTSMINRYNLYIIIPRHL